MKLVALVRRPSEPDKAAAALAEATKVALAEARMRLAPEPPALIARLAPDKADELAAQLRADGFAALAVDEKVPTDAQRVIARTFEFGTEAFKVTPRFGEPLAIAWSDVALVLRGVRVSRETSSHTETQRRFSLGSAVVTQGLKTSRNVRTEVRSTEERVEHVLLVYDGLGQCAAVYERQVSFACLGPLMQPAGLANIELMATELEYRAPGAIHDDRLVRLARRPLPFIVDAGATLGAGGVTTTRASGAAAMDVLAEVLFQASVAGMYPPVA